MDKPQTHDVSPFGFGKLLQTSLVVGLIMGFGFGLLESLIVGFRVLGANSFSFEILLRLVKFGALAVLLYAPFFLLSNAVFAVGLHLFNRAKRQTSPLNALVFLNVLWISFFSIQVSMNYYTSAGQLLKFGSLLTGVGVFVGCGLLAWLSVKVYGRISENVKTSVSKFLLVSYGFVGAVFFLGIFASSGSANAHSSLSRPNVLLIIVDTLRPDHLGTYGYERNTSPNMDQLADGGIVFERAYVPWGSSTASHASILTGQYPFNHDCWPLGDKLDDEVITFAEILKKHGYATAGFVTNVLVGNGHNFDQGFDMLLENHPDVGFNFRNTSENVWLYHLALMKAFDRTDRFLNDSKLLNRWTLEWLERQKQNNFFLWIQTSDPHCDYNPPDVYLSQFSSGYDGPVTGTCSQIKQIRKGNVPFGEEDAQHMIDRYDGEIAYTDVLLKGVYDKLKELDLFDNTIVVITADHGEIMQEDMSKAFGHGGTSDAVLRVPLIMYYPPKIDARLRADEIVETIDIVPTLLDLLEMERPGFLDGQSLTPFFDGSDVNRKPYAVSFSEHSLAMRTPKWKLARLNESGRCSLYNVADDPAETNDLSEMYPAVTDSLKRELERWMAAQKPALSAMIKAHELEKKEFDKETMQRLKTLGYIN